MGSHKHQNGGVYPAEYSIPGLVYGDGPRLPEGMEGKGNT